MHIINEEKTKGADEIFCYSCGSVIKRDAAICPHCGAQQKGFRSYDPDASPKSRLLAFILCTCVGVFGVHRFYVGRVTSGVLQILFGWATLFIWNLVDWIMILVGSFRDVDGKLVKNWDLD
ncbi:MAG: TM2 domain-containing protein [Bacteroidales bacterium]|nr:TM2 domain-containing protein [Bacteroidales bacterium]MDD2425666.1 TM2 domain-containing protein [Bacteroidales bacterium]MDD3989566.1 TM2 domain-containing protein [Bacteroidales bacterium]MDD4638167.1 TM2 domain-containing protein [Bacteroidales bacterium]